MTEMNDQPHDPRAKMTQDQYQDHMDDLAKKIGAVLVGQRVEDGIIACTAVAAFGMVHLTDEQRGTMRAHLHQMTEDILTNNGVKAAAAKTSRILKP